MKLKAFLLMAVLCLFGGLHAADIDQDKIMWESAYLGNYSLVHKMILTRPTNNFNDQLFNQLIMAYLFYRTDRMQDVESIFKGVDAYLEGILTPNLE